LPPRRTAEPPIARKSAVRSFFDGKPLRGYSRRHDSAFALSGERRASWLGRSFHRITVRADS